MRSITMRQLDPKEHHGCSRRIEFIEEVGTPDEKIVKMFDFDASRRTAIVNAKREIADWFFI